MRPLTERQVARFWTRVTKGDGCWLWTHRLNEHGYGMTTINSARAFAHRLSWQINRGQIPEGMQVLHDCDVRHCVNPEHLYLGTHADNMRDVRERHRGYLGHRHVNAKLKPEHVIEIRASSEPYAVLARRYGCDPANIRRIKLGMVWKYLL